jgi:putative endonuclease
MGGLTRKQLGGRGEELAARYLQRLGYRLLARNYRTVLGELDLIAQDGPEVVFVEVKTRMGADQSHPEESVNPAKVERLARLAESYLAAKRREETLWRIDVVAVVVDRNGELRRLDHLRNAVY